MDCLEGGLPYILGNYQASFKFIDCITKDKAQIDAERIDYDLG